MDPLQWMGAVRMRVQTANKNKTVIHTSPLINVLWSEKLLVYKKEIHHEDILTIIFGCP